MNNKTVLALPKFLTGLDEVCRRLWIIPFGAKYAGAEKRKISAPHTSTIFRLTGLATNDHLSATLAPFAIPFGSLTDHGNSLYPSAINCFVSFLAGR